MLTFCPIISAAEYWNIRSAALFTEPGYGADAERSINPFLQLWRTDFDLGGEPPFIQSFKGVGIYEQKAGGDKYRFRKFSHDDLEDETVELNQTGGWLTMMQHYFMAAVLPAADEQLTWVAKTSKTRGYLGQYLGAPAALAPGAEHSFSQQIYIGPKLQNRLTGVLHFAGVDFRRGLAVECQHQPDPQFLRGGSGAVRRKRDGLLRLALAVARGRIVFRRVGR